MTVYSKLSVPNPDGGIVTVVSVDWDEFNEVLTGIEPVLASQGVNIEALKVNGMLMFRLDEMTSWLYSKYEVDHRHVLAVTVRGFAARMIGRSAGTEVESADGRTVMAPAPSPERQEELAKSVSEMMTPAELAEVERMTDRFVKKIAPNGAVVNDILTLDLRQVWADLEKSFIDLHGRKDKSLVLLADVRAALERIWLVNPAHLMREWDYRSYLIRLIGMALITHRDL